MSFSFFGCWNSGHCKDNPFHYVSSHIKGNDSEFVIAAGDNYYPEKNKVKGKGKDKGSKTKKFDETNFDSGFVCLVDINKPTYVLMGNHDVQYEDALYDSKNKKLDKCHIIGKQLTKAVLGDLSFETRYLITSDALILFLNTSLYTSDKNEMLDCFQQYKVGSKQPSAETIDEFIDEEYEFFKELIRSTKVDSKTHKLIIVGHHPIISVRDKKTTECLLNDGLRLLEELYSDFNSEENYYLCADVHQYQTGEVTMKNGVKIIQHVVGTGGTTLDDVKCNDKKNHNLGNGLVSYEMTVCDNKSHGYLLYADGEFTFIPVNTNPDTSYDVVPNKGMLKAISRTNHRSRVSRHTVSVSPMVKSTRRKQTSRRTGTRRTQKSWSKKPTSRR